MTYFFLWYALFAVVGLAALPLTFSLLPGLADRGYAFSRTVGLLLWGYLYWLLGSLGLLRNDFGSLVVALALVAALSIFAASKMDREALKTWWAGHFGMVIVVELLFLLAFAGWSWIRAMNPEITATEKPMELAFLNSVLRSPAFPPNDPWLSGYAISYYYFGYVLIGMLAMVTGTTAGIAFNLGIASIFALTAVGAYGILYNLLSNHKAGLSNALFAVMGPIFVLLVSNLEGFLDMLHARGLFWTRGPDGILTSGFWRWLDLKDLVKPPAEPFSFLPQRYFWWWRASRVVNDVGFTGGQQEVIDEFPFFSFLLADLHPHVLAIPFVLLAIVLAWHVLIHTPDRKLKTFNREIEISSVDFLFAAVVLGSLAFLNTWDFPIYVGLFTAAFLLREAGRKGWTWQAVGQSLLLGLMLGISGVLLYFPFFIGFSSQAGGILPNVLNPTRGAHLWVMFGTLFIPLLLFFAWQSRKGGIRIAAGLKWGFGILLALWVLGLLIVGAVALNPASLSAALQSLGAPDIGALAAEALNRRFTGFGGWLTLVLMLSVIAGLLVRRDNHPAMLFLLLMSGVAVLLILAPEFVYLRDLFGTRMNTIFKFYYQAWILMSLSAAYAAARVIMSWRGWKGTIASLAIGLTMIAGLVYPVLSLVTKTNAFNPTEGLSLDGTLHGAYLSEDDRAAVAWLASAELGTLVEAVGGSYSNAARIAAHSGQPNVLGWKFHEGQWRGGYEEVGSREEDIAQIYSDSSWTITAALLDRYGVDYIYLGNLERSTYRVDEAKLRGHLPVLFEQGSVVIFGFSPGESGP